MASVKGTTSPTTSPIPQKPAWKPGEYKGETTSPPKVQKREVRKRKNVASPETLFPEYTHGSMSIETEEPGVRTSAIYVHDDVVSMYVMAPDEAHIEMIETSTKDKGIVLEVGEPEVRVRSPSFSRASARLSDIAKSNSSLNTSFSSPPLSPDLGQSSEVSQTKTSKVAQRKSEPIPQKKIIC